MKLSSLAVGLALCTLPFAGTAYGAGGTAADQTQQPTSGLALGMTIYAGGITIGKVDMDAKIVGDNYHVVSNLETSGVVNAFWQSEIQASSSGKIESHLLQPTLYDFSIPDTPRSIRKFRCPTRAERRYASTPIRPTARPDTM